MEGSDRNLLPEEREEEPQDEQPEKEAQEEEDEEEASSSNDITVVVGLQELPNEDDRNDRRGRPEVEKGGGSTAAVVGGATRTATLAVAPESPPTNTTNTPSYYHLYTREMALNTSSPSSPQREGGGGGEGGDEEGRFPATATTTRTTPDTPKIEATTTAASLLRHSSSSSNNNSATENDTNKALRVPTSSQGLGGDSDEYDGATASSADGSTKAAPVPSGDAEGGTRMMESSRGGGGYNNNSNINNHGAPSRAAASNVLSTATPTTTSSISGASVGGGTGVAAAAALRSAEPEPQQLTGTGLQPGEYDPIVAAATATATATQTSSSTSSETKKSKIALRVLLGAFMFTFFSAFVYMGHLYVSGLVALIELLLFRELVRVRYNAHFDKIQNKIPFFRTTQWCWFVLSIVYTYGDFVYDVIQSNPGMHHLNKYLQYLSPISFVLYSGVFVLTISTLQPGYIKFQMNQLCWTTLVILLTVGQLKYVFHNIYNGLIWFVLPCCLVFTNDIAAYVTGVTWGRKFIQRKFLALSPNKTWEGFIGGWVCTMITAWYLAKLLAQFPWMTCPTNRFTTVIHAPLSCTPDSIFLEAQSYVPSQIFELLPDVVVKMIPGVVDICLVKTGGGGVGDLSFAPATSGGLAATHVAGDVPFAAAASSTLASAAAGLGLSSSAIIERLTPCVSGDANQVHHHFELTMRNHYPIQVHALWLGLFASLVAPFGGFLASAMKRAYGIKDFDSLIPGHGGVMDRMDCQFLMALCTWVHYNTFVKLATVSVPRLTYLYGLLTDAEKMEFLKSIATAKAKIKYDDFLSVPRP